MMDSTKGTRSSSMSSRRRRRPEFSSVSAYTSASPTTRRSVSFARSDDIKSIPPLSDMKKKEVKNMWFTDKENWLIKKSLSRLIGDVLAGTYEHDIDGLESEWRGLEKKTIKGSQDRKMNRYIALVAVLEEQNRQRRTGKPVDATNIAILYRLSSSHCQRDAIHLAANDAELAREYQEQQTIEYVPVPVTTTTTKPSRKRISTSTPSTSSTTSSSSTRTRNRPTVVFDDDIKSPHPLQGRIIVRSRKRFSSMLLSSKNCSRGFSPSRLSAQVA